jgi:hypothetical protein
MPSASRCERRGSADRSMRVRLRASARFRRPCRSPVSAGVYPPALLVLLLLLTGEHPRGLVLAYYAGPAILTISAGLIVFAALKATGVSDQSPTTPSGSFDIVLGVAAARPVRLGVATTGP